MRIIAELLTQYGCGGAGLISWTLVDTRGTAEPFRTLMVHAADTGFLRLVDVGIQLSK